MAGIPAYPASGGCQEHNLMDSIPQEDRASLLPIIRLAFPFLNCPILDAMPSCDDGDTKHFDSRTPSDSHEIKQVPHLLASVPNLQNMSHLVEAICKSKRNKEVEHESKSGVLDFDRLHNLTRPSEANFCRDREVTQSRLQEIQRINQMRDLQYNFILPSRQQNKLLPNSDCAREAPNTKIHLTERTIPGVKLEEQFSSHDTAFDASSNITNDKLSLSLASMESGQSNHGHTDMAKLHPMSQATPRATVMKQCLVEEQELLKLANSNNASKDTGCGIARSIEGRRVAEQSQTKDLESLPFVCITKSTASGSLLLVPPSQLHGRPDRCTSDQLDLNDCVERESYSMPAKIHRNLEQLGTGSKVGLAYSSNCDRELKSELYSTKNEDEGTIVSQALSCPGIKVNEQKPERCRRSNGKQWRCSQEAAPGLFYCELHHDYQKRIKTNENTFTPLVHGQNLEGFVNITEDVKDMASVCTGQKRQLDMSRCRRNDGKLWQCSRPAIEGSIYCEHHHQRRHKKTKVDNEGIKVNSELMVGQGQKALTTMQKNSDFINAVNTKQAPSDGSLIKAEQDHLKAGNHHSGIWNGAADMQMNLQRNAVDSCGNGDIPHAAGSQQGTGATTLNMNHNIQGGQAIAIHDRYMKMPTSTLVTSNIYKDQRVVQASQEGERCHRKDGKKWQCSQLCKPGFSYCEHHLGRTRNKKQTMSSGTQNMFAAGGSNEVNEHDHIDQEASSADKHKKAVKVQRDENWSVVSDVNMKRCQRKDGKGWQCSQNAKAGFTFCEHHIGYQSKHRSTKEKKAEQHDASSSVFDHSSGTVTCLSPCNNTDNQLTSTVANEQSGESHLYMTDVKHENFPTCKTDVYDRVYGERIPNMKTGSLGMYDENLISSEKNDSSIRYEKKTISGIKHDSMRMFEEKSIVDAEHENFMTNNQVNATSNSKQVCNPTGLSAIKEQNPFSDVKHEIWLRYDGTAVCNSNQIYPSTSMNTVKEENPFSNSKHEILRSEGNAISNTKVGCPSKNLSTMNPFFRDYGQNKLSDPKQENVRSYRELQFGSSLLGSIDGTSVGTNSVFSEHLLDRFAFPTSSCVDVGQGFIQRQEMGSAHQPLRSAEDIVGVTNVFSPLYSFSLQGTQHRENGNGCKILPNSNVYNGAANESEQLYRLDQTRLNSPYPLPAENFENSGMCNMYQSRMGAVKYPSHSMELFKDPKPTPLTEAMKVKLWPEILTMGCARDG